MLFYTGLARHILGSLVTYLSMIAAEVIALVVSWRKAAGTVREVSQLNSQFPLVKVLVQDGIVLFLVLLVTNIFQIVIDNVQVLDAFIGGTVLLPSFSTIMMCRFIMNLNEAADRPGRNSTVHMSVIRFNSGILVGNLGESLHLGNEETSLDVDEDSSHCIVDELQDDIERPRNPVPLTRAFSSGDSMFIEEIA
ncbi:hypothetical protein BDY19DRAFT_399086 [Irpex rosettiformis]|uniref:Uncharacterized protein n=1 Tax=Irpex rosettiformis TaxID=378272 RepID=A0ACB8UF22_9APHY|nr:hypothetical protein BDY19DRAFT_399086 [Irpex rosettiformis]